MSSSTTVRCYRLKPSDYATLFSSVQLKYLFSLFHEHQHEIRLVGGAVRDLLLGASPHDIDLATTATTEDMLQIIQGDSNIELVYTRAEQFGTLTLIVGTTERKTFQVTTLKGSIVRQGKDVRVEFTRDWSIDAQLRDLSINSLSMDDEGMIYDYTGGVDDLKKGLIQFNGHIRDRLCENPIRILRYFRFFSRLSSDTQVHSAEILEAIEDCATFLKDVPTQKIWIELKLILRSPLAGHVMRTMFERHLAPILCLPNSIGEVFELENRWLRCRHEQPEPMTLLVTLFDDQDEFDAFCTHMKCSSRHKQLGHFLLNHRYSIQPDDGSDPLSPYKTLILHATPTQQAILHRYAIELLKYQGHIDLLHQLQSWTIPTFPLDMWDLGQHGLLSTQQCSRCLRLLKEQWRNTGYRMNKDQLIEFGFQSGLFYI